MVEKQELENFRKKEKNRLIENKQNKVNKQKK